MNSLDKTMAQIEAALAGVESIPTEAMRLALVTIAFGTSVELTAHLVHASDAEIRQRFIKQLERTREMLRNELAARWN